MATRASDAVMSFATDSDTSRRERNAGSVTATITPAVTYTPEQQENDEVGQSQVIQRNPKMEWDETECRGESQPDRGADHDCLHHECKLVLLPAQKPGDRERDP